MRWLAGREGGGAARIIIDRRGGDWRERNELAARPSLRVDDTSRRMATRRRAPASRYAAAVSALNLGLSEAIAAPPFYPQYRSLRM